MSGERQGQGEAYGALAALALIWGYTWVMMKVAAENASPFLVAVGRPLLGAIVLFAVLALRGNLRPPPFVPTLILGLLQTTAFSILAALAVTAGGAGKVVVLAYTMPFWIVLFAWPLLGEKIAGARWIALVLAAVGLGFVVSPLDRQTVLADALAVMTGMVWALSAVWTKMLRARGDVELLSLTTWQMIWGTVPLIVVALIVPEHIRLAPETFVAFGFIGLISQSLGWLLWAFILSRLPAGVAGIASLATPVVGVSAAALQLHEIPSHAELTGMALIVVALVVNAAPPSFAKGRAKPEPARAE
ncbi:MAG TPA: EamA family transporter [Candidatus Acidoferrum sp.]|nr:EamA family transporter [Candidatus Acidoferrum sp.]